MYLQTLTEQYGVKTSFLDPNLTKPIIRHHELAIFLKLSSLT